MDLCEEQQKRLPSLSPAVLDLIRAVGLDGPQPPPADEAAARELYR